MYQIFEIYHSGASFYLSAIHADALFTKSTIFRTVVFLKQYLTLNCSSGVDNGFTLCTLLIVDKLTFEIKSLKIIYVNFNFLLIC